MSPSASRAAIVGAVSPAMATAATSSTRAVPPPETLARTAGAMTTPAVGLWTPTDLAIVRKKRRLPARSRLGWPASG